jgi:hypothetical protein
MRSGRIRFDFPAEVADINSQEVQFIVIVYPPDLAETSRLASVTKSESANRSV